VILAVGLFFGIRYGVPLLRERYFLKQPGSEYVAAGQESPEEFQAKFLKALQTLKGLPQLKGREDPLYVLPWYLLIGEGQPGKTTALRGADLFSPLITPSSGEATQNCDWWISNTAVILDTSSRYVAQTDKARDRAEWYRLLRLLRRHRDHEPINGLLIAVSADALASQSEEKLRADGSRLRERIEEAVRELGCDFPIYLIINKCDQIEGFSAFFTPLRGGVQAEVIGYVDDSPPPSTPTMSTARGEETLERLSQGLQTIYDRLHRFRLSLLDGKIPEALKQPIFCFPEEFKALQSAILAFAKPLFSFDTRYHTPRFRGIFLTSAYQGGTPFSLLRRQLQVPEVTPSREASNIHYFLHDLFLTILPRDRGLVATTAREQRRRGFSRFFAVSLSVGLLLFGSLIIVRASNLDRQIVASVDRTFCPAPEVRVPSQPALESAETCRKTISDLAMQNQQRSRWQTLWFTQSFQVEEELRQQYMQHFQTQVLIPLNAELDRTVQTSEDPLPLVLLLARRVQLGQYCASASGCPEPVADDLQPDYALMLNPQRDPLPPNANIEKLKSTYLAYLSWQPSTKDALQQDLLEDNQRLQRLLSSRQFTFDRLLLWVNRRSPPITYEQYWELPPPLTTVAIPQVAAACTKKAWEQEIAALLQQIQDAVPDVNPQLRTFRQQHITDCLTQWQRFLVDFPQGADRWKGSERRLTLATRFLSDESPYQRVLADAWTNVSSWISPESGEIPLPPWTSQLRTYVASEQKQSYMDALRQIHERLQKPPLSEASFNVVKDAFAEGKPPEESTNPIQRALLLATQLSGGGTAANPTEVNVVFPLLEEPIRYVWNLVLEQAALYVQQAWTDNVLTPVAGLPPAERLAALHGPGGKVGIFTEQLLKPLLSGTGPLGAKVALPPDVTKTLEDEKQLKPLLAGNISYAVQVRAGRRSDIEGITPFLEDQTILTISCAGKPYRITTRPRDFSEGIETQATIQWSYQSCGDVSLTIYFYFFERERRFGRERRREEKPPPVETNKRIQLTKRYPGSAGFLRFLQDFAKGEHRFQLSEFDPDPEAGAILQEDINSVNVYYSVTVPPQLNKLTAMLQSITPPNETPPPSDPVT
jgi:type VI secretion system protein ImpL